jgi:hypothetical protein
VVITPEGLAVTVSTEKWKNTQGIIAKWSRLIEETGYVQVKEFESDVAGLLDLCDHTHVSGNEAISEGFSSDAPWVATRQGRGRVEDGIYPSRFSVRGVARCYGHRQLGGSRCGTIKSEGGSMLEG